MTRVQRYRLIGVVCVVAGLGVAALLASQAFRENLMYFYTPSDLLAAETVPDRRLRLGGMVETGSVQRGEGLVVGFVVADCAQAVRVEYEGILPDLFREGQGIVAMGRWDAGGRFVADEVLAKHDENYMPPDLAEAMMSETGHACEPFKSAMEVSATSPTAGVDHDR
ncbi:cytochrome c maturation protein CcmE [Polycyclovorans algicola]|uniref:cytochrome c maturation protein CcmE n=1 Tax=Polycyclovorans algicola TaxID=616992 RepID=UPI00069381F4|nr:cytochrome c maturation protein CcmE [Polycyclovorans algicola]